MEQRTPEDILKEAIYMCDHKYVISTIGEPKRVGLNDKDISYTFVFYDTINHKEYYHQRVCTEGLNYDQCVIAVWKRMESLITAHNNMVLEQ